MPSRIGIYVFSFNRAQFLANCLNSIALANSGSTATVIDDGSNNPETLALLAGLPAGVLSIAAAQGEREVKTGGLYANMNLAMQDALSRGLEYAFFIQDDMQIVRPFFPRDFDNIDRFFAANPHAIQLDTCFRKRQFAQADRRYSAVDSSSVAYFRQHGHPGMRGITDLGVFHIERFLKAFGQFESGEVTNERKALSLGLQVGYYVRPNMMWLPFPEAWRGKAKGLYLRLQEYYGRAGYYPYRNLTEEQIKRLFARDPAEMPIAEDWLNSPDAPASPRWSFAGGLDNVRARGGAYAMGAAVLVKLSRGQRK